MAAAPPPSSEPHSKCPSWFKEELQSERKHVRALNTAFKYGFFFRAFVDNHLHPLSLLWILPIGGVQQATNMLFWPARVHAQRGVLPLVLNELFSGSCFIVANLLFALDALLFHDVYGSPFTFSLLVAAHIVRGLKVTMIAIKYGFMSAQERNTVHHSAFDEAMETNSGMQLLSIFHNPHVSRYLVELERVAANMACYGLQATECVVGITEEASNRLCSRLSYDATRLGLPSRYVEALKNSIAGKDGRKQWPLSTVLVLVRLSAHPKDGIMQKTRGGTLWSSIISQLFVIVFILLPFSVPEVVRTRSGEDHLAWLLPPSACGCQGLLDAHCACVSADWSTLAMLGLLHGVLLRESRRLLSFLLFIVLESYRLHRSLELWGRALRSNGWPRRWDGASGPRRCRGEHEPSTTATTPPAEERVSKRAGGRLDGSNSDVRPHTASDVDQGSGTRLRLISFGNTIDRDDTAVAHGHESMREGEAASVGTGAAGNSPYHPPIASGIPPTLGVERARDLWAWLIGRTLLRDFGGKFWTRLEAFMSVCVVVLFAILVLAVSLLALAGAKGVNLVLVYTLTLLAVMVAVPVLQTLLLLLGANELHSSQRFMLSRIATGVDAQLAEQHDARAGQVADRDGARAQLHELERVSVALTQVAARMDVEQTEKPLTMLQLPATREFLSTVIAAVGAVASAIVGLVVSPIGQRYQSFWDAIRQRQAGDLAGSYWSVPANASLSAVDEPSAMATLLALDDSDHARTVASIVGGIILLLICIGSIVDPCSACGRIGSNNVREKTKPTGNFDAGLAGQEEARQRAYQGVPAAPKSGDDAEQSPSIAAWTAKCTSSSQHRSRKLHASFSDTL